MDSSSPEDSTTLSRFGLHSAELQQQHGSGESEEHDSVNVPRSVPDSADFVPEHSMQEEEYHDRKDDSQIVGTEKGINNLAIQAPVEGENYGHPKSTHGDDEQPHAQEKTKRPELPTMDTATTIDVDRRIPGSIW